MSLKTVQIEISLIPFGNFFKKSQAHLAQAHLELSKNQQAQINALLSNLMHLQSQAKQIILTGLKYYLNSYKKY